MELPIKIAIASVITFTFGILFGWVLFPILLRHKIASQVALKSGSEMRDMNLKLPFPLDFRIFFFNVTNVMEVMQGGTPVLDEIGPYFYEEWKEKVHVVDNEKDDTITFNMKNTYIFNQKKSGKLTGDEIVTIPHPMLVGGAISTLREKPSMLNLLNKAIAPVFRVDTIFLSAPVRDILFDGVMIYCNVSEFAAKGLCNVLRNEVKDLDHISDSVFGFSFFGMKNGTVDPRKMKIKRGIQDAKDVGRVIEFDGKKDIGVWGKKDCDAFQGTDSTIFPPFLKEEEGLWSFTPDICRCLPANFVKNEVYKGIPGRYYTADFGDMSKNPKEKCFCPTNDTCLKKGVMDLTKCIGAPIVASLPHFLGADPSYSEKLRGLHPNEQEHGIYIDFEPMSGTPMEARKRMQFNMPIQKIEKITLMKELSDNLIPMFWIEEGVALNDDFINQIKTQLLRTLKIVNILKWFLLVTGGVLLGVAGYLYYKKDNVFTVTPIHNEKDDIKKNGHNIISTIGSNMESQGKF